MRVMRTPRPDALRLAADWLASYEGVEPGGADAVTMAEVAAWLLAQADAAELRAACKDAGVPVAQARKAIGGHA